MPVNQFIGQAPFLFVPPVVLSRPFVLVRQVDRPEIDDLFHPAQVFALFNKIIVHPFEQAGHGIKDMGFYFAHIIADLCQVLNIINPQSVQLEDVVHHAFVYMAKGQEADGLSGVADRQQGPGGQCIAQEVMM